MCSFWYLQGKNVQIQAMTEELEALKRQDPNGCSQLKGEVERLQQQNSDLSLEKSELGAEIEEMRLQIRKMTPYGGSPLGRIRELELQFTQVFMCLFVSICGHQISIGVSSRV